MYGIHRKVIVGLIGIAFLNGCHVGEAPAGDGSQPSDTTDSDLMVRLGIKTVYLDDIYRYGPGGSLVLDYQPWVLYDNGYALQGIDEPLNNLNPEQHRADHPELWHSWRLEGEGSQKEIVLVDFEGDEEILKAVELFNAGPVPKGSTLSGVWTHVSGAGTDFENSITVESTISFLENGEFTFDRLSASSFEGPVDVASLTADPSRRGHYNLNGFNIVLSFDDGAELALGFYSWLDDNGALDTDALGMGGQTYLRE